MHSTVLKRVVHMFLVHLHQPSVVKILVAALRRAHNLLQPLVVDGAVDPDLKTSAAVKV